MDPEALDKSIQICRLVSGLIFQSSFRFKGEEADFAHARGSIFASPEGWDATFAGHGLAKSSLWSRGPSSLDLGCMASHKR